MQLPQIDHCSTSETSIITVIKKHVPKDFKHWESTTLQTFFDGQYRKYIHFSANGRYFTIGPQSSEDDQITVDVLIQQFLDDVEALEAEAERHMYEIHDRGIFQQLSPWLCRTNWMTPFDGKNMKVLHDLLNEPKCNSQSR